MPRTPVGPARGGNDLTRCVFTLDAAHRADEARPFDLDLSVREAFESRERVCHLPIMPGPAIRVGPAHELSQPEPAD